MRAQVFATVALRSNQIGSAWTAAALTIFEVEEECAVGDIVGWILGTWYENMECGLGETRTTSPFYILHDTVRRSAQGKMSLLPNLDPSYGVVPIEASRQPG
jgi:hypothetical protein